MKRFVKALFITNAGYTFRFFPSTLICLFAAIFVDHFFWFLLLGIIFIWAGGVVSYLLYYATGENLWLKYFFWHFNDMPSASKEHEAMKRFEQDPSAANFEVLHNHLKTKK